MVGVSDGTDDVVGMLLGRREGCDEGFADGFELGAIETVGLNDGLVDGAVDKLGSTVGSLDGEIVGMVVGTGVGFDGLMRVIFICKGFSTIMLWLNEQINIACMFSMTLTLAVGSLVGIGVGSDVDVMHK